MAVTFTIILKTNLYNNYTINYKIITYIFFAGKIGIFKTRDKDNLKDFSTIVLMYI